MRKLQKESWKLVGVGSRGLRKQLCLHNIRVQGEAASPSAGDPCDGMWAHLDDLG